MHPTKTAIAAFCLAALNLVLVFVFNAWASYSLLLVGLIFLGILLGTIEGFLKTKAASGGLLGLTGIMGVHQHTAESTWQQSLSTGVLAMSAFIGVLALVITKIHKNEARIPSPLWGVAGILGIAIPSLWFGVIAMGALQGFVFAFMPFTLFGAYSFVMQLIKLSTAE